jgi:hypothetical protein
MKARPEFYRGNETYATGELVDFVGQERGEDSITLGLMQNESLPDVSVPSDVTARLGLKAAA